VKFDQSNNSRRDNNSTELQLLTRIRRTTMTRPSAACVQRLIAIAIVLFVPGLPVAASAAAAESPTAGKQIRVKMSLHVTGNYQHTGPKVIPQGSMYLTVKSALDNSYTTEYVVAPETILTGLQKTNPLDPASQKEMDDYNARVKAQNDRIYHSADDLRGKGPGAPAGMKSAANPMAMMNPEMMQKIMACGQDQACKRKVGMEMMAQQQAQSSGPGAQVMADMQAISNMCISKGNKLGSKGYEDCMNAEGEKRSTVKRSAADNEAEIPELPDRYLLYSNAVTENNQFKDCQFKAHAKVNESYTLGSISDGEGGGAYGEGSFTDKGEGDYKQEAGLAQSNLTPCVQAQAVFDPKTNLFWTNLSLNRADIMVVSTRGLRYGVERPEPIDKWIAATLSGAPASGSKTQTFGFQTATFTWSFVRE
jgi:hypothetical protein